VEITDLTEYQDATIGVVMYRARLLLPVLCWTKVPDLVRPALNVGTGRCSSTSILTCCRKLELFHQHEPVVTPNRPAAIVLATSGTDPPEPQYPQYCNHPHTLISLVLTEYARGCSEMFAHVAAMSALLLCQSLVCARQRNFCLVGLSP
jgi:hypothetical protein